MRLGEFYHVNFLSVWALKGEEEESKHSVLYRGISNEAVIANQHGLFNFNIEAPCLSQDNHSVFKTILVNIFTVFLLKNVLLGARPMVPRLRALATLPEDPSSTIRICGVTNMGRNSSSRGPESLF